MPDLEVEPAKDLRSVVVREVHVFEFDHQSVRSKSDRAGPLDHGGLAVHQGADPVRCRGGPLDLRVNVRELPQRVGNAREHDVEGQQLLDRHRL